MQYGRTTSTPPTGTGGQASPEGRAWLVLVLALAAAVGRPLPAQNISKFALDPSPLEFSGKVNHWRLVKAVGERAGVWGFENGRLEGWVYPLKIFRDFHLDFQLEGLPKTFVGDEVVRSVRVFPHMVQLQYVTEEFSVVETLFVPREKPGFVILLDITAPAALRVFVRFRPELNLMWPGALGGQTCSWDPQRKAVWLGETSNRFSALIGSPAAVASTAVGYRPNLSEHDPFQTLELRVPAEEARRSFIPIAVTARVRDAYDPVRTYEEMLRTLPQLYSETRRHYLDLEEERTEFITPDQEVNQALRWSRVSLDQLKVCNPHLGCSYVSGYGSSGTGTRPMYAWFFDEPVIASWANLASGGVQSVKQAFRFIQKYQRADGKIMHEVSQSAAFLNWFKDYPFAYIHPDSSLWYLTAMGHLRRFTGDEAFIKESWPSIRKAYEYCLTILDPSDGLLKIPRGEWGSTEAALFTKDAAMAGEWIAALRAMRQICLTMGEKSLARDCEHRESRATDSMERRFWNPELQYYNYGFDAEGRPVKSLNPMIGYSAWLGSLPEGRARAVLEKLSTGTFLADWGQRNISLEDPRYDEGSYQGGSVWPFLTAAPILAHYRYHNAVQGFLMWKSMIRLRTFNSRGAMPEVLSGRFYHLLDNSVPHQMFSEHGVIPSLVEGIMGLDLDVPSRCLRWSPHLPPEWPAVEMRRFPYGADRVRLSLRRSEGELAAAIDHLHGGPISLDFSPALPAGSKVLSVLQDGRAVPFRVFEYESDVHVAAQVKIVGKSELTVRFQPGIEVEVLWQPLLEGQGSRNLRIVRNSYKDRKLELLVEGLPDVQYRINLHTPWRAQLDEGGRAITATGGVTTIEAAAPVEVRKAPDRAGYVRWAVRISFADPARVKAAPVIDRGEARLRARRICPSWNSESN
jgi:hypothetical protein